MEQERAYNSGFANGIQYAVDSVVKKANQCNRKECISALLEVANKLQGKVRELEDELNKSDSNSDSKHDIFWLAKHGDPMDREILCRHKDYGVRKVVAQYGSSKDRRILREDKNVFVRIKVAKHGSNADRKFLRNDPSLLVRKAVAEYGSPEDREALKEDVSEFVRKSCRPRA